MVLTQLKGNIVEPTLHQKDRFLLKKVFLILSNQHWLRSWHNCREDPFNVDGCNCDVFELSSLTHFVCWNPLLWKPPRRVKKTHCGLNFHFGQFDRSEFCTEVSFTTPEVMWTLIMKLPHTEVKFYPEVKSQTGLSSLRVSCKRAHSLTGINPSYKKIKRE